MNPSTQSLSNDIDTTARNAASQIESRDRATYVRSLLPTALMLLVIVPVLAIAFQIVRWLVRYPSWTTHWLFVIIPLTLAVPMLWLFAKVQLHQHTISRHRSLREIDNELGSTERIATADEFLQQEQRDGFMQAAVEDATDWAQRGRTARLSENKTTQIASRAGYFTVPIAIAATILATWLAGLSRVPITTTADSASNQQLAPTLKIQPPSRESKAKTSDKDGTIPERPWPSADKPSQQTVNRQGSANAAIPDNADDSQGKLSEGETRESQQSANPSSARGTPSASGQPSKSGDETERKPKKKSKKKDDKEREKKERKQEDKPSGATAGQGSSKGSDNSAAPSDWASTSQAATPDDEDADEEDEVDDEEEEQESRGGVQPNMRDRRTPVNRDLQIGFGSNRPNPDANGRGGPGGQKKSRGVASLVLGVPIPDRVHGQANKGRIRITQQRITPEAEQSDAVDAADRMPRSGAVGPIHHPEYSPWLMDIVRRYFMERRAMYPLKTDPTETSTNTTSKDSLQTTSVTENESPSS